MTSIGSVFEAVQLDQEVQKLCVVALLPAEEALLVVARAPSTLVLVLVLVLDELVEVECNVEPSAHCPSASAADSAPLLFWYPMDLCPLGHWHWHWQSHCEA